MPKFTLYLISVIFLDCIIAAPLHGNGEGCKQTCPTTNKDSKLNYQPGQVYNYAFDSNIAISLTGNDPQDIQLQVQGTAHVHGLTADCQYGLDLQDVTVSGNGKRKLSNKDQLSKIVQFTLSNDKLGSEICAHPSESDVSLNIKRALISMFQLNDGPTDEVDVFGKCYTNYAITKPDDGSMVVTKTRDLNACSHREKFVNGFITGVFNEDSNIKSTPVMNGDYTNEVRVNGNGIIESSQVTEDYQLVPFSNGDAGVRVRVSTTFRLKEQKAIASEQATVSVSRPLTYEVSGKPAADNNELAKKSLMDICNTYVQRKNSVGPQVASQFIETIRLFRFLTKDDILLLFNEANQLKDQSVCRRVFLDAVFRVSTADSVNAIASLLENGKIPEKRLAYLSFNLATSVNKDTITIFTKLLEKDNLKETFLSAGNLIKKYCQKNSCENDPELTELFDKLAEKLGNDKSEKRHQQDVQVAILKGLRNAKGISGELLDRLIEKSGESQPNRIRAAAIQAFPSTSCDDKVRAAALNILKDRKDDSEFRIEAYLSLVQCSTPQIAEEVSKLLHDEPIYQVGSFITSHLSNLRSSTDLHREKSRNDFADVYASKKFPSDIRKFSFNHELSYEFGSLGLGGSTDSNVIFSQNSFLPRSIRTNITGELFGTSFNLFEFNGRQENLELILERYLGAKGFLNSLNKQEAANKLHALIINEPQHKHKRAIHDDAGKFAQENVGKFDRDVDFDASIKMFGSEMYFLSLGDNLPTESKGFISLFTRWTEGLLKNTKEGKKTQFDGHSLFLDAEFSYPTSIGFPLKIQSQGAGAFHLETTLKADLKDVKANPKSTKFSINAVPSYNVELTGIVSVDAHELTTGVKVSSNVHSSTGSTFSFELLNGGKGVDMKIDFPFDKQEVFSFNHKIAFFGHFLDQEAVQYDLKSAMKKDAAGHSDCFDQFHRYLGITVCYQASHNPFKKGEKLINSRLFPLNGPAHVSAYIQIDKQYHFKALYDDSDSGKRALLLTFDTPQSELQRKIDIKVGASYKPKLYLSASVTSPYRNAEAEIGLTNNENELTLYGKANGHPDQYAAKFGFKKGGSATRLEYTPIIEVSNAHAIPYKVSGKVIADTSNAPKTKYIFEKLSIEPTAADSKFRPLALNGWFETKTAESYETSMDIQYDEKSGSVNGKLLLKSDGTELDLSVLSNFCDHLNGKIYTKQKRGEKQVLSSFVLVYGKDLLSTTKRIEVTYDYQFEKEDNKLKSLTVKNVVNIGPIPLKIKLNGSIRKNHVDYEFLAEYTKYTIASNLQSDCNRKAPGDWSIQLDASANKHKIEASSVRDIEITAQKSSVTSELKSSFGTVIILNAKFDNELSRDKAEIVADGNIVLAKGQKPLKLDYKLSVRPKHAETSGKIVSDTTELVKFNAVLNRNGGDTNTPTTGTLELNIYDLVSANGDYNSLKGDGKSELVISFARLDRKVKVETKYNHAANKFDLRNDFYYDFEKDNSRHIAFDTKNKYTSTSFDSVNEIDINDEKLQFTIEANGSGSIKKGKHNGKFLLRLPTQREISGILERDVDVTVPMGTGRGIIKLTDKLAKAGGKTRSLQLEGSFKDANFVLGLFDFTHKLTFIDFENKDIVVTTHAKHLPKGEFKMIEASVNVGGSVPSGVELNFGVDEYCDVHAIYHASAKYGNNINVDLKGDYALGKAGSKPSTFKMSGDLVIPNTKLKKLSFDTRASVRYPESQDVNGQYEYDFKFNGRVNDKDLSVEVNGKASIHQGDLSLAVKVPDTEPFALDVGYTRKHDGDVRQMNGNVQVRYGNGKNIKITGDNKVIENKIISFAVSIITPYEKLKNMGVSVKLEKKGEETYATDAELNIDSKKYKIANVVIVSRVNPSVNIDAYYPQDGHSQVSASLTRTSDRKYKSSIRLVNLNGFHLTGDAELSYQSLENFGLIIDLNSQALKANKLHVEVHTKQNGNNKGIEFSATEQNKNIVSGTAEYAIKEEKGKTTVDGKGSVNWYDQSNPIAFQFMKNVFDQQRNDETGVLIVFTGQVGQRQINAELKVTNKEFHIRHTICEPGSQCMNIDINSKLTNVDWKHFTHNLLVTIDLRKLGFKHEFNLKSDTKRNGLLINHSFDTHILSPEQNKYQYKVYVTPETAGIELSTPKRSSAFEAQFTFPKNLIGVYKATITSYLDKKNNPNKRSTFGFEGEIKQENEFKYVASGALTARHPSVKELKVSGKTVFDGNDHTIGGELKFDVFKNTNQAIVVVAKYGNSDKSLKGFNVTSELSLKSIGLGVNYAFIGNAGVSYAQRSFSFSSEATGPTTKERFALYLFGNTNSIDFKWIVLNDELLKASAVLDTNKKTATFASQIRLLGSDSIDSTVSIAPRRVYANVKHGNYLSLAAEASPSATSFKAVGNQKQLLNFKVALDQASLLSTDYNIDEKDLKEFLKSTKTKLIDSGKLARNEFDSRLSRAKQSLTSQVNAIKDNLPDFSKFNADYKEEFKKFTEDLLSDKSIKELVELYQKTFELLNKTIGEILRTLISHFEKISKTITDLFKYLYDGFNERIVPSLKESWAHIEQSLLNLYDEVINAVSHLLDRLVDALKKFEEDFKKIGKTAAEWFKKASKTLTEQLVIFQKEFEDFYKLVVDYIKALPGLETLKEKYNEVVTNFVVPDNVIQTLKELAETLKHALQMKELNELITSIINYVELKIQQKPVNDLDELKKIAERLWNAVQSLLKLAKEQLNAFGVTSTGEYFGLPIPAFQKMQFIPHLSTLKFSIWNYILYEPLPSIKDLLLAYRPQALNPINLIPPFVIGGHIVDGEYLFTFGGGQLTLPGSCHYVLAKDIVDGNFTVVAKIAEKKLQSIGLVDKSGDSIEVNSNGKITVNDKAGDYPVQEKTLFAWRNWYSVNLLTTYGTHIVCTVDLKVCQLFINGYYHSKLRGLLGKGGYEVYDEHTLPNGKIASSATEFVNAYKLHKNCPNVNIDEQHKHDVDDAKSPECEKVFGSQSSLRFGSLILDGAKWQTACQHAVKNAVNKQEAACDIASGFVAYARSENVPLFVPRFCRKCEVTDDTGAKKSYEIGERYTIPVGKKADIVLVVDTGIESKHLTELVQHLISQLRHSLKKEYDTHVSVVGYKKGDKYPSHFTSDGKLDITKFDLAKKTDNAQHEEKLLTVGSEYIDPILQKLYNAKLQIQEDLSLSADGRAFREALSYPFRSNAHKAIIAIRSDVLKHSSNPLKSLGARAVNELAKTLGVGIHMLAPISELEFGDRDSKSVVGFNDKAVLLMLGQKSRPEDRQHINYHDDLGIDLVQSGYGYTFSLTNYDALDQQNQKQFLKVAASAIAKQMTKAENESQCICVLNQGLLPREICRESKKAPKSSRK